MSVVQKPPGLAPRGSDHGQFWLLGTLNQAARKSNRSWIVTPVVELHTAAPGRPESHGGLPLMSACCVLPNHAARKSKRSWMVRAPLWLKSALQQGWLLLPAGLQ